MLNGKRVVITGGARGLGEEFARASIAAGARVVITDILEERGRESAARLGAAFVPGDVGDPASIERCAREATQALGGIDGLVNCAAITSSGGKLLDELDIETWDKVMAVNVRGLWLMTRALLPELKRAGNGKIVNIASDTPLWGAPRVMAYVASKGAVIAMTRSMARELGPHGIAVNTIAPGLTLVEATESIAAERHQHYVQGRAMQREQRPEDLSGALVFLLSDSADFVTGQLLPVNGGFVFN